MRTSRILMFSAALVLLFSGPALADSVPFLDSPPPPLSAPAVNSVGPGLYSLGFIVGDLYFKVDEEGGSGNPQAGGGISTEVLSTTTPGGGGTSTQVLATTIPAGGGIPTEVLSTTTEGASGGSGKTSVPEPSTLILLSTGLIGVGMASRRRNGSD